MASKEMDGKREIAKASKLPDHIVNFVDFKREMVRLDYTAECLRRSCQEVEEKRSKMKERLRREKDQLVLRQQLCNRKALEDDQETLQLQAKARQVADRKRHLQAELHSSRRLIEELIRKRAKLQHWLDGLEEHRVFLCEIIGNRRSSLTSSPNVSARRRVSTMSDSEVVEVMQSPGMIRSRLALKERNVITQSRLVFETCQLGECSPVLQIQTDESQPEEEQVQSAWELELAKNTAGMYSGLNDEIFVTIHRIHQKFISSKSQSYDAMKNFAAIERYVYYVLQMVDACDPVMLKRIIAKVVVDKKKAMEQQKVAREAAHREERERKAMQNATSAPAKFKRVDIVGRKLRPGNVRFDAQKSEETCKQEAEAAAVEDLDYLFRLQL